MAGAWRSVGVWGWAVGLASVLLACGDDADPGVVPSSTTEPVGPLTTSDTAESGSTGETGASTDESSTGVAVGCPSDSHVCTAAVPPGWNGPVVWTRSDPAAPSVACEGSYPLEAFVAFDGFAAPAPACACSCALAADAACPSATLRWWNGFDTCTGGPVITLPVFANSCNALPNGGYALGSSWTVDPVPTTGGSCAPLDLGVIEPWAFAQRITACGGAEITSEGCDTDEICTPRGDGPHCVWRLGDETCPDGFAERRLLHRSAADERACEPCTCGSPRGLCDGASVILADEDCDPVATLEADAECRRVLAWAYTGWLAPGPPTAFCEPSTPVATGDASPTDPVTLCCR